MNNLSIRGTPWLGAGTTCPGGRRSVKPKAELLFKCQPISIIHYSGASGFDFYSYQSQCKFEASKKNEDGEGESEADISEQYEGDTDKDQEELEDTTAGSKNLRKTRPWFDTTGEKMGVFLGVLLLQGEAKLGSTKNYWKCQTDRGCVPAIHYAMSLVRWHQIRRYLKISNPTTDLDSKGSDCYTKVEPLYSNFVAASQSYLKPGRHVSVDEQLIIFKVRSRHSMQIGTKAAGVGFKI